MSFPKRNSFHGYNGTREAIRIKTTGYYRIPNRIFCFNLTATEFTVYSYLVSCAGDKLECWPSYNTIAGACRITRSTAIIAVDSLVQKRLIDKLPTSTKNKFGRTRTSNNHYFLNDLSAIQGWSSDDTNPVIYLDGI